MAGLLLAACSGQQGFPVTTPPATGPAHSGPSATSPPGSADPSEPGGNVTVHDGAPSVPHPVDVAPFKTNPCSMLTLSQLNQLGITGKPHKARKGAIPVCTWDNGIGKPSASVGVIPNPDGLSAIYKEDKQRGKFEYFKPVDPINGFPAVIALIDDGRKSGDCSYDIGLNNADDALVVVSVPGSPHPCQDALQVAKDVTLTAKGGG